uniref:Uncharacterized protein n=1 Tax=Physcomitrium patens TaxID=3218 RepID=A0A7I3ZXA9_PHYPA
NQQNNRTTNNNNAAGSRSTTYQQHDELACTTQHCTALHCWNRTEQGGTRRNKEEEDEGTHCCVAGLNDDDDDGTHHSLSLSLSLSLSVSLNLSSPLSFACLGHSLTHSFIPFIHGQAASFPAGSRRRCGIIIIGLCRARQCKEAGSAGQCSAACRGIGLPRLQALLLCAYDMMCRSLMAQLRSESQ